MNVTVGRRTRHFRTVSFHAHDNAVHLVDQRLLPHRFEIVATHDFQETARAIREMTVRGAGAIGATAAYGLAQGVRAFRGRDLEIFSRRVDSLYETPHAARPTAVDPVNALNDVRSRMLRGSTAAEGQ